MKAEREGLVITLLLAGSPSILKVVLLLDFLSMPKELENFGSLRLAKT